MEKQTINFSTSTPYKAPKCKCVELQISRSFMEVLPGSGYGDEGKPGSNGSWIEEEEDF